MTVSLSNPNPGSIGIGLSLVVIQTYVSTRCGLPVLEQVAMAPDVAEEGLEGETDLGALGTHVASTLLVHHLVVVPQLLDSTHLLQHTLQR